MFLGFRELPWLPSGQVKTGVEDRAVPAIEEEGSETGAAGEPSDYEAAIAAAARDARR